MHFVFKAMFLFRQPKEPCNFGEQTNSVFTVFIGVYEVHRPAGIPSTDTDYSFIERDTYLLGHFGYSYGQAYYIIAVSVMQIQYYMHKQPE